MSELMTITEGCAQRWRDAVEGLQIDGATSKTYTTFAEIGQAILPFVGEQLNYCYFLNYWEMSLLKMVASPEAGCLAFVTSDRGLSVMRPQSLTVESFADRPEQSVLLLDLAPLSPSGVHDAAMSEYYADLGREPVIEGDPGNSRGPACYQPNCDLDNSCDDAEAVSKAHRLVTRWLSVQVLITAKCSSWRRLSENEGTIRERLSAVGVRRRIGQLR